jgi:hypothetical protein
MLLLNILSNLAQALSVTFVHICMVCLHSQVPERYGTLTQTSLYEAGRRCIAPGDEKTLTRRAREEEAREEEARKSTQVHTF